VREFLLEGLLLALAGGAGGLTIAWAGSRVLSMLAPADLPRSNAAILDVPVFLFGLLLALVCGVALSVAPALSVSHTGLERALRGSGRGATVSRTAMSARRVLTVAEVALALILVVGAGLLIASVHRLRQIDLGLDASNVIVFDVNLPETRYAGSATRTGFHQEYQRRLSEQPGVSAVGAISWLPVSGPGYVWGTRLASSTGPVNDRFVSANQRAVQGEYFAALGIAVLRGRQFGAGDVPGAPPRSVINGSLASAIFPDGDAVGGYLWISGQAHEIIGVVDDVALDARGTMAPVVYHPYAQFGAPRNWRMTQVVSFERETGLLERARNELRAVDPGLVLHSPRRLSDVVGMGTARERFAMTLLVAFALLAVLLAALGIYGVLANAVARRRREIGVRLALGARDEEIRRMVVGQGVGLAAIGVGFGVAGALALARLLASLLFEVSPADPRVLLAAAAGVVAVAVLASWVPARAATRVSPVEAFGTEDG
jgi:predicted permease